MNDLTNDSDRLIEEGRRLRDDNRSGGRHRLEGSIGKGSANIKLKTWIKRAGYFGVALLAILIASSVMGIILNGIGFVGIMTAFLAVIAAGFIFANYPKVKVPKLAELNKGDVKQMVGRTELWLEHQRPALPPPAVRIVDDLGVQLDTLGAQLETVDQSHPQVREIRKLVGDVLPETIESYRKIPQHLRGEQRAGATPDQQVTESLQSIGKEIDSITRQLAEGSLDDLAIKHRYLGVRSGADGSIDGDQG